jgi:outer membrane biosynthesis protein TonB
LNKNLIFGLTIIISSFFLIQPVFSQEPEPPKIPEPSPEPKPIKIPEPEPIREPFPEESDTAKIQRLTEENTQLREDNFNLQVQITELNKTIENLHAITMEQIKVILALLDQLRETVFENPFSSEINL